MIRAMFLGLAYDVPMLQDDEPGKIPDRHPLEFDLKPLIAAFQGRNSAAC